MDTLKNAFTQAKRVWERSNRGAQIMTVALAVISLVAIVAVGMWSIQPQYHPLASGLAPDQLASVISNLEADKISYQLNHAGTSISVPKSQWSAAKLSAGTSIITDGVPPNLLETSTLDAPVIQKFRMHRNQERTLQSTIAQMKAVKRAIVHISQNEEELFVRPEDISQASVMLELEHGRRFSGDQVAAVIAIVSHAVVGLAPENVTVTDTNGNILSSSRRTGASADMEMQLAHRQSVESWLGAKAETMLSTALGPNNAVVRVHAELDFDTLEKENTIYDSDGKVTKKEFSENKTTHESRQNTYRPVGTSANINGGTLSSQKSTTPNKEEILDAEYLVPQTVENSVEAPGAIKRLTVAAMVDLSNAQGKTPITTEQIKSLIQGAIGFDATRDDLINVIETELPDLEPLAAPVAPGNWDQIRDIVKVVSLGLASLVALVFGWLTLRRVKPITLSSSGGSELDARRTRIMSEISQQAARDPETVSRIVAAWLDEPLKSDAPGEAPQINKPRNAA